MQTLIHADIFFFITSVVVVILALFLIVILFYVIYIVRDIYFIVDNVKRQADSLSEDIADFRLKMKEKGRNFSAFVRMLVKFFLRTPRKGN